MVQALRPQPRSAWWLRSIAAIERSDIRVATVFLNAKDYADLRKWDRDTLDIETQAIDCIQRLLHPADIVRTVPIGHCRCGLSPSDVA